MPRPKQFNIKEGDAEENANSVMEALKEFLVELIKYSESVEIYALDELRDGIGQTDDSIRDQVYLTLEDIRNTFNKLRESAEEAGQDASECLLGDRYIEALANLGLAEVEWKLDATELAAEKEQILGLRTSIGDIAASIRHMEENLRECKDDDCFSQFVETAQATLDDLPQYAYGIFESLLEEIGNIVERSRWETNETISQYLDRVVYEKNNAVDCVESLLQNSKKP